MKKLKWLNILNPAPSAEKEWNTEKQRQAFEVSSTGLFDYTLITFGHKRLNPWVLAQYGMSLSPQFSPLIAINPIYNHPVETAQKIATLSALYKNNMAINLITGSFFTEMESVNEKTNPDQKRRRLLEFHHVLNALLTTGELKNYSGEFYQFSNVRIHVPQHRTVDIFISGQFANAVDARNTYFIQNIRPSEVMPSANGAHFGLGLGICSRITDQEAQTALQTYWPRSREGEILFKISLANSETPWNKWLKEYIASGAPIKDSSYCLQQLMNFHASTPYLVGSYSYVRDELSKYINKGYETFLIDFRNEDYEHIELCLRGLENT